MAQIINPNVKEDDSLNTIVNGLRAYSTIQDMGKGSPASAVTAPMTNSMDAIQRRLDSMNYQYADSIGRGNT